MASAREKGFSAVEVFIVLVVIAVVGVAGFALNKKMHKNDDTAANATSAASTAVQVPTAPAVSKTSDLDTAQQTLDNTDLNAAATDTTELDAQLSGF